ncbi:CRISPR-associated protein [Campylobacter hyointestinalis]|uniref:hypothetical protein n=1 Tax=Campylobacter hyointestinalis TaxID=198 RepID=UPI000726B19E|nr:hypothetical protein [Campylobacter hyointestinalis]PPB55572.1 hypothetical protein CDQ67_05910 [Campylobacter hyointestinalis subsp. hyointestinalis]CUU81931.1 CRISPR-associated protein [Campylobacter hyointestinalis]
MKIAAFDIGISSIGWCLCEQNDKEYKVIDCGVRIFTAAEHRKTGDSLAAPRREARLSRRRLYRRRTRLAELRNLLCTEFGLDKKIFEMQGANLPQIYKTSKEILSPWELRVKASSMFLIMLIFVKIFITSTYLRQEFPCNTLFLIK